MDFNSFLERYAEKIFNIAYSLTNDVGKAEDLSSEAFIKLYQDLKKYQPTGSFLGWLNRVIYNLYIDGLRKQKKIMVESLEQSRVGTYTTNALADTTSDPQKILEKKETEKLVQQSLNLLPYEFKIVLILADMEGHSYEEISQMLKCPLGTIKSRISRGRKMLRENLKDLGF